MDRILKNIKIKYPNLEIGLNCLNCDDHCKEDTKLCSNCENEILFDFNLVDYSADVHIQFDINRFNFEFDILKSYLLTKIFR